MAVPGAAVGRAVIQTPSLIPLVERVGTQLEGRRVREQARQDTINKEWTDMLSSMSYDGLDPIQNKTISSIDDQMMKDYTADVRKYDGSVPQDVRMGYLRKQTQNRASRDRMLSANQNVMALDKSMKEKDYYLNDKAKQDAYNKLHVFDEKTKSWVARDDVNPQEILDMLDNADYIDPDKYFQSDLSGVEAVIASGIEKGPFGGEQQYQEKFKPFWKTKPDGTPIRDSEGKPMLDWEATTEMLVKNPDKRKIYQALADKQGQTLPEFFREKMIAYNTPSKTYGRLNRPYQERTTATAAAAKTQAQTYIDTLSGIVNQNPNLVRGLPQSDILSNGVPYRDATELFQPYRLTSIDGKSAPLHKVLLKEGEPGSVYIQESPDSELRKVEKADFTNLFVSSASTLNTALRNVPTLATENQNIGRENEFIPSADIPVDPEFIAERKELAQQTEQQRTQDIQTLKQISSDIKDEGWWGLSSNQANFTNNVNEAIKGKRIIIPGKFKDTTINDPNVEVDVQLFGKNKVIIKDGDVVKKTMTADEFGELISSEGFIVPEKGLRKGGATQTAPIPDNADEIGMNK